MTLSSGTVVVQTENGSVTVNSRFGDNVELMTNTTAGIVASEDRFTVHCFTGTCVVQGSVSGDVSLSTGEQVSIGISGIPNEEKLPTQNELFGFSSMVATPTATPTPTNTPTPPPTSTATNTPIPATATPTETPTPEVDLITDSDGDGVPDSLDQCPDALKTDDVDERGCHSSHNNGGGGDDGGVVKRNENN